MSKETRVNILPFAIDSTMSLSLMSYIRPLDSHIASLDFSWA